MTEEEKNTVRSLREQGYGYKTISNITGIHRETIKSHLKRHPCEVGSTPPRPPQCQIKKKTGTKKIGTPTVARIVPCKQCGEPFNPKRKGTLFCCDECRQKWWAKNKYKEGTPHTLGSGNASTCIPPEARVASPCIPLGKRKCVPLHPLRINFVV